MAACRTSPADLATLRRACHPIIRCYERFLADGRLEIHELDEALVLLRRLPKLNWGDGSAELWPCGHRWRRRAHRGDSGRPRTAAHHLRPATCHHAGGVASGTGIGGGGGRPCPSVLPTVAVRARLKRSSPLQDPRREAPVATCSAGSYDARLLLGGVDQLILVEGAVDVLYCCTHGGHCGQDLPHASFGLLQSGGEVTVPRSFTVSGCQRTGSASIRLVAR